MLNVRLSYFHFIYFTYQMKKEVDKMKKGSLFLFVLTVFLVITPGNALAQNSQLKAGWVIGNDENNAVILHTKNGGKKWVVQGKWAGYASNDISAVNKQTAWAASGSPEDEGIILHTTNGGVTWTEQELPDGVDSIKNIKGLTRHEAWAVSLAGTILHTTDGGEDWSTVPSGIDMTQINRMDAIGCRDLRTGMISANVWIVDHQNGQEGMIHTLYNGDIWRQECVPYTSMAHMVSAYSPRVAWSAGWFDGTLYRTADGGENWENVAQAGANDIDDMCAYSADALWLVQFQAAATSYGIIYHVRLEDGKDPVVKSFIPYPDYRYEGLTCVNDQTALVVGYTDSPDLSPKGIILVTNDGGDTWERQPLPVDDVKFWKVSFVGARR